MSEYQYYEFLAIDRPLTEQERAELREISSRAQITATSFVNEYNYGDLRADPATLMERYFDAHLYMANWGTRALMLRLPLESIDAQTARAYLSTDTASVTVTDEHLIISLRSDQDEPDDEWLDAQGQLAAMVQARADLAAGDLRLLYLGWLLGIQSEEADDDDTEPPVPAGLGELSGSLRAVADFLRVDPDLLAVAATVSAPMQHGAGMSDWIATLPQEQKDSFLIRVAEGDGVTVAAQLRRRYHEDRPDEHGAVGTERTVLDLWTAGQEHCAEREAAEAELLRQEREREAAAEAARYARHLDELGTREDAAWERVASLIATKGQREYDLAVTLLADLQALAQRNGGTAAFTTRVLSLREQHKRKPSLIERFNKASLPGR